MRPRDTSPEAWKTYVELERRMPPAQRARQALQLAALFRPGGAMNPILQALRLLAAALDRLEIRYAIGGSFASSARGARRFTEDLDLVARIRPEQTAELAEALGKDWIADPNAIRRAIESARSFNLIYIPSVQKFDIFPAVTPFHLVQLSRADELPLEDSPDAEAFPVTTAEDVVLGILQWYRAGGEVSERQWSDITGVLLKTPEADLAYLRQWAERLEVADLLEHALRDAASDQPL
ncbi:MAG TPA: hypothetical protein VGF59_24475 [Bryobacteraceae bacterium]